MPRRNHTPKHQPFIDSDPCQSKRRFATAKMAEDAAEIQELSDTRLELSSYKCERCGYWHLTRQKRTADRP